MANHMNDVFLVRVKGEEWVMGDSFWPKLTEQIEKANRSATRSDAKSYLKTAAKRLKKHPDDLEIVPATEERDDEFQLVGITPKEV